MPNQPRILLVEGNKFHTLLVERLIVSRLPGGTVQSFSSAETALTMLENNRFDLAIISGNLKGFRKFELLDRIREIRVLMPVIVLLSQRGQASSPSHLQTPATRFLTIDEEFPDSLIPLLEQMVPHRRLTLARKSKKAHCPRETRPDMVRVTASTLAHEINNPLMTILGTSELILGSNDCSDREVRQKIRTIRKSAQRIETALRQLSSLWEPAVKPTASGTMLDRSSLPVHPQSRSED